MSKPQTLDEIISRLYVSASLNETIYNRNGRTSEEYFAHKDAEQLDVKAALSAMVEKIIGNYTGNDLVLRSNQRYQLECAKQLGFIINTEDR